MRITGQCEAQAWWVNCICRHAYLHCNCILHVSWLISQNSIERNLESLRFMAGVGNLRPQAKCGPRQHLIWPALLFSFPNFEHKITSKRRSMMSKYCDSKQEASIPQDSMS